MRQRRILVDMDGIIVNLMDKWLRDINSYQSLREHDGIPFIDETVTRVTREDIKSFDIHKHVEMGDECYKLIQVPGFFDDLPPLAGALEGIRAIESLGHDLVIASSPAGPDSARAKLEWVSNHLGWGKRRVILCHDKSRIEADAIIDDKPSTIRAFRNKGCKTAVIEHPYNGEVADIADCFASGWHDTENAWAQIVDWARWL